MPVSKGFRDFLLDQLEPLGGVLARPMFGGLGLYHDGRFFGLVWNDTLYLKAGPENRGDFELAGTGPFRPYPDRPTTMQYFEVPPGVVEDADELARWARKAMAAVMDVPPPERRRDRSRPARPRRSRSSSGRRN
jgi:DNA transformation protein